MNRFKISMILAFIGMVLAYGGDALASATGIKPLENIVFLGVVVGWAAYFFVGFAPFKLGLRVLSFFFRKWLFPFGFLYLILVGLFINLVAFMAVVYAFVLLPIVPIGITVYCEMRDYSL